MAITEIGKDIHIIGDPGTGNAVAVQMHGRGNGSTTPASTGKGMGKKNKGPWVPWGELNNLPLELVELIYNNCNKPELLNTQAGFISGSGIRTYTEAVDGNTINRVPTQDKAVDDFFKKNNVSKWLRSQSYAYAYFANTFTEFILSPGVADVPRVISIRHIDSTYVRAAKMKDGQIPGYYVCDDWSKPILEGDDKNVDLIPAYDAALEIADLPKKFIFHSRVGLPGQPYYDLPNWYGTRYWTELANILPDFHISGIKNGYNIKYHIQIPRSYFEENYPADEQKTAEEQLRSDMDQFLAGNKNNMKAFISRYKDSFDGKPTGGWTITPLANQNEDKKYAEQFNQANQANTSGHGIAPSLAGIDTAGKLSSGSEMRLAYQIYIALKTPIPREVLMEPLALVQQINGWNPAIKFGIQDIDITTLAEQRGGQSMNV